MEPALNPSTPYRPDEHWNPKLYVLNCLGELKQQIWYNQYSISEYEKEIKGVRTNDLNHFANIKQHASIGDENQEPGNDFSKASLNFFERQSSTSSVGGRSGSVSISKELSSVIVERRRITGQFWQTLDLKNFPTDVQNLTITLTTPKQDNEIELEHCKNKASSVNVKCFADSQEWRLYR